MPLAVLAVLKAGCVYIPLDPIYPDERVNFILDQADVRLLLTQTALAAAIPSYSGVRISLDSETDNFSAVAPSISRSSADLAYIIYTSGSTGRPKGVEVTHRSFVNLLLSMARAPSLDSTDVLLALTTIAFDIAGLELMLPLAVGARVVIASREMTLFPAALLAEIDRVGATVIQATPTTWRMLADLPASTPLKMLCGGEALPPDLAARLLDRPGELWNMYGPTETTIWSAVARIERADAITIGRPIANTQFYVLDETGQPVPARRRWRTSHRWRRRRARLLQASRPDRREVRARSVLRCVRRADVSHRRPRALSRLGPARVHRPPRSPGETSRLSN